ncbi:MAG: TSUP family transporter, partial [Thermoanaerobaculia bacterium]
MAESILLAALGAVAGLVGALLGIGGGVILVPVLYLACELPLIVAVGTSLLVVTGTSLAGAAGYLERDLVLTDVALELQLGAMAGALAAARAAVLLPERMVAVVFATVMVWSAASLWWRRSRGEGGEAPARG